MMGGRGSNSGMMKTVNGKTVKRFNTPPYRLETRRKCSYES